MYALGRNAGDFATTTTQTWRARRARTSKQRLACAVAATSFGIEPLESRRMMSVAINGSVTLDESSGLQTSGIAVTGEDNNDSDVALNTLPAALSSRLFGAAPAGLALSSTFATAVGAAKSADNFIAVTETGTIVSLGFTKADGTALPVLGSGTGAASGLSAISGGAISLFQDSSLLGNRLVLGVDTQGHIACALFMDPNAGLTQAKVWMVQLEALSNPDATNFDDAVTMGGLGVAAGVSTAFNFNALPSGQNLFGTVGTTASGLVVIGKTPVLNPDGSFTNASNTINTSQGGGPTTIGVDNQMFDTGDGGYFTFVKNPVPNFLAGAPNGLDQNEADLAGNIQYTGGTSEVTTAFVDISQIQGNSLATMDIRCNNIAGSPQGTAFVSALGSGPQALITAVRVFNANGDPVNVPVTITNGVARVAGVGADFRVEWDTSTPHDQVLITGVVGKFDIGGFGAHVPSNSATPLTGIRHEDDGPRVDGGGSQVPTLTVDETTLATNASVAIGDLPQFVAAFGQDGSGSTTVTYALKTPGGDSGLVDTASGEKVMLSLVGGQVQGRTETGNVLVFTVSLNASNSVVLDQIRAVVHPNANDPNETKTILAKYSVEGTGTATDADGDNVTTKVEVNGDLAFKDDGPSITASIVGAPTLTVDDTNFAINDTDGFNAQFTPVFGNDGAGATPVTYALSTPGGASGLVDTATKQAVNLSAVGGVIQGRTAVSNALVFTVSVDALGNVTLDQLRSVVHANTADPNDTTTLASAGLVVLTGTATDKDADHASTPLNIGLQLVFADDGPKIGDIASSIVNLIAGATVTKTLNGATGNDPNAAPYTIDSFTASVTVNGVLVKGVLSADKQSVTYYADTNNDTVFGNAGDTAFYRLTLQNQGGAGEYKFDVLATPPPALLEFDFDDLPSGQNLFGTVGDTSNALVVIGKTPVLNADGTFTNASNTINTSQGGGGVTIGINNQMFDPGDGAYFTLVKSPVANFLSGAPDGLDQNEADDADNIQYTGGTLETTSSFTTISQTQGNSAATMKITAFDIANAPQGQAFVSGLAGGTPTTITSVKVNGVAVTFQVSGNGVTVGGLDAGDQVEWTTSGVHDRVLIECVAGKFDIGAFGTTQVAPTPDQVLNFVARATDGDGDFATDGWSIGIDGTGIFDDDQVVLPP